MPLQILDPDVKAKPDEIVVGIDLGTTHSAVAIVEEGKPLILGSLVPSVLTEEGGTLSSTKRLMGRSRQDPICNLFSQLVSDQTLKLKLGTLTLTPVEVASTILSKLIQRVQESYSEPIGGAVITVPAYFDEAARIATKQAAALAGIKVLRLLNEPTAAALAYGLEKEAEGTYAIYDFGGGTFDISILKLEQGVFQVLATGGDLSLGGDDIDHALADSLQLNDPTKARKIKEQLTDLTSYDGVSRGDLNQLATPIIEKTIKLTASVLKDAALTPQDICGTVLVGGMTRMPLVRKRVAEFFGKEPLSDIHPDHAVALGAALSAHGLKHGSENLLLDVTPLSLGLETMGGLVEKIIPRNTPLPALASQEFTTQQDGQTGLVIHVLQGEREFVSDCRSLARFELFGIPPLPAGMARVRIDFSVDVEGLLTVSAFEKTTGASQHVEVRPTHGLDDKTLAHMILESQKHGREDMERRQQVEHHLSSKA